MLFRLWRRYVAPARYGYSWLEAPFLRGMQAGNGLWFFAPLQSFHVPERLDAETLSMLENPDAAFGRAGSACGNG